MPEPGEARPGLIAAMLEPGFYPTAPSNVELRETNISWVFLAGGLAYKVKKPLVLPFLDYGTLERRREMCREEVRLNRRLAPRIYLDVVAIAERDDGFNLTSEDDERAIEYAVRMNRVAEGRSLAALAERDELEIGHVEAVADLLARFHAEAEVVPAGPSVERLASALDENALTLGRAGDGIVDETRVRASGRFGKAFLASERSELERRERSGLVRDCHGDLRAEHLIVPEHEAVYVYDCIEFDPSLRKIDVAADLAFLVMDLTAMGEPGAAARLVDRYRRAGGEPGSDALLAFLAAYRAWVRAKVECLRAGELAGSDPERERCATRARHLMSVGHRFAWRARGALMLVVYGVSGSGKTTLANELADVSGWMHVSSDRTRKRLAGIAPTERGGSDLYSPAATSRTYRAMGEAARRELGRSEGVIVDATFHGRDELDAFRAGLGEVEASTSFVRCVAPSAVLRARVRERERDAARVSDAGVEVLEGQLRQGDGDIPGAARLDLDTTASVDELVDEVEEFLDRRL